jgi:Immunoglobulin domain
MRRWAAGGWAALALLVLGVSGCGAGPATYPTITTEPVNASADVGQTATFTVVATGQAPLSYQWYQSSTTSTGTITTNGTSASYTTPAVTTSDSGLDYFVIVSNSLGSVESTEVTLTVDSAPRILNSGTTEFLVDESSDFIFSSTGTPLATWTETGALPSGVTFVSNGDGTATLAGTPTATGTFPLTVTAANGVSPNATQNFSLFVETQAPAFTSVSSASFIEDLSDTFSVTTTGGPIPSLTETGPLPPGITFVDNKNGTATISGVPTELGTFDFTITAANGILPNAVQSFILNVTNSSGGTVVVHPGDVPTLHNDNARTSQNDSETLLAPSTVSATTFGKVADLSVDGAVDAQPLFLTSVAIPGNGTHDVLYVATENDSVYAFDAATDAVLWQQNLTAPGETAADAHGCAANSSSSRIGINSTPAIDRSTGPNGTIFVVANSKDSSGNYIQRLHALDAATGVELAGGPQVIRASAAATNSSGATAAFTPSQSLLQGGLLSQNGTVYGAWAPCGVAAGNVWVMGFNETALAQNGAATFGPVGTQQFGSPVTVGLSADSDGDIFYFGATGSMAAPAITGGTNAELEARTGLLKLGTATSPPLANSSSLQAPSVAPSADAPEFSTGVVLLPGVIDDSGTVWQLAVSAGTDGTILVVNRNAVGASVLNAGAIYQEIGGELSASGDGPAPAYFDNTVYFSPAADSIIAFPLSNAQLSSVPASETTHIFASPGAAISISASSTFNGVVWAVESGNPSVLHAYDATNLAHELYNSAQAAQNRDALGPASALVQPVVTKGKVYVATPNGVVVFGLLF